MFTTVLIRNWQSLRSVDLDLGRFTVIVGASSSGKSAFMRAMRALAATATGSSAITRGASSAAITAHAPAGRVTLEYSRGGWRYRLLKDGNEIEFSKLNRSVPDQITDILALTPALNFAGQFDRPFLLTESGAAVARTLGELTNVDTIYAAVREANRRKATAASTLKTRRADLDRVNAEAARFTDLPDRLAVCEQAEATAERAHRLSDRITRLSNAIKTLEVAENVLARTAQLPEVPDLSAATAAERRLARFGELLREASQGRAAVAKHSKAVEQAIAAEARVADEHRRVLATLGVCPVCAQPVGS